MRHRGYLSSLSMEISFGLHYQQNLSEESSGLFATTTCAVIGLSLPSGLEATLPVTLRANGFSSRFFFPLRPKLFFMQDMQSLLKVFISTFGFFLPRFPPRMEVHPSFTNARKKHFDWYLSFTDASRLLEEAENFVYIAKRP